MKKYLLILLSLIFATTHVQAQYHILSNSLRTYCDSVTCTVRCDTSSTLSLDAYFGDGSMQTYSIHTMTMSPSGFAYPEHRYATLGTYSVKYVLKSSGIAVDSVTSTDSTGHCNDFAITAYEDLNGNCVFDRGDIPVNYGLTVEIDSAGVTVDSFSAGTFWYTESGPIGTVYTYKFSGGSVFNITCPSSGIIYDTVGAGIHTGYNVAVQCSATGDFDLSQSVMVTAGRHHANVNMTLLGSDCRNQSGTFSMAFSPKYSFTDASPRPLSISGNIITWSFTDLSSVAPWNFYAYFDTYPWLTSGDTIHSSYYITPLAGETDTFNNLIERVDTIRSSYDPNEKSVTPEGIVKSGTTLTYNIGFENTGNAPAENIHVQDTLSDNVDPNTFKLLSASANVYTSFAQDWAGHRVVKFDFPGIQLLDSSHHGQCDGMVSFTINTKAGLAAGTKIDNRAGIYFDDNDVVMTNTVENTIGTPMGISNMTTRAGVSVYPNPVNNELTMNTGTGVYSTLTVTDLLGRPMISRSVSGDNLKVDVSSLSPGMYFIKLSGEKGVNVAQFEKL